MTEIVLHDAASDADQVKKKEGLDQFEQIVASQRLLASNAAPGAAHVIPPEQGSVSLDAIQATSVWCSYAWTPISCRSLGFAIGPFKVLEDPEYFGPTAFDDVDKDDDDDRGDDDE